MKPTLLVLVYLSQEHRVLFLNASSFFIRLTRGLEMTDLTVKHKSTYEGEILDLF